MEEAEKLELAWSSPRVEGGGEGGSERRGGEDGDIRAGEGEKARVRCGEGDGEGGSAGVGSEASNVEVMVA